MCSGFVFDAPLNEEVVAEDLSDGSIFLKHVTAFACFFWEGIEEIECGAIRIHGEKRRLNRRGASLMLKFDFAQ